LCPERKRTNGAETYSHDSVEISDRTYYSHFKLHLVPLATIII
jgi:hypothetical protein